MNSIFLVLLGCFVVGVSSQETMCQGSDVINDEVEINRFLSEWNVTYSEIAREVAEASWNWETNITDFNQKIKDDKELESAKLLKKIWGQALCIGCTDRSCSETMKRRVELYKTIDEAALPDNKFANLTDLKTTMQTIYSKAEVCRPDGDKKCLSLEPDLSYLLKTSRDYCELQWAFEGWHDESGRKMRHLYIPYVNLINEAARLNGYQNAKEMWTKSFWMDEPGYFDQMEEAWRQVKPLYEQLHAFVRQRLRKQYSSVDFPATGHLPAHILGNMWAQNWNNLFDLLVPDENAAAINITQLLLSSKKKIDEIEMFQIADTFFQSIGCEPMTEDFWKKSSFFKRNNTDMVCHGSAWDFYQSSDFRIKMCTEVDGQYFQTVHHEMGHIQYYMLYRNQPVEFRDGANPGFHEAVGDLIALSVMTPDHLKAIDLLPKETVINEGTYLNSLMKMALEKIAFLPFGYLIDKYRWDIFEGKTSFNDLNSAWWKLRCSLQGIAPPIPRSEEDFDAGAKYHVPASVPYDRYFFSHILQFQLHVAICRDIGYKDNFHKCDIYKHPEATKKLRDALKLGKSTPYPKVLKMITGTDKLDGAAILDYFQPLMNFLEKENKATGEVPGWSDTCDQSPKSPCNYVIARAKSQPPAERIITSGANVIANTPLMQLFAIVTAIRVAFMAILKNN